LEDNTLTDHIFAYARVSTKEQREDRQLDALTALHILENPMLNGETIRVDGAIRMQPR